LDAAGADAQGEPHTAVRDPFATDVAADRLRPFQREEHPMTTYQTPHPVRLRLKLEAGRIDIITWDEPRAEVEVTPLGTDQASIEAAQSVEQELRGSGESQELSVEAPSGRSLFGLRRGPELRFAISVPHGSAIDATTVSADLAGRG